MNPKDQTKPVKCEECGVAKDERDGYYDDGDFICQDCIYDLPNETGHCGLSCRRGKGCDESC